MPQYRCYNVDPEGRTIELLNFSALGDAEAILKVGNIRADRKWHAAELWEAHRQITGSRFPLSRR
jgi:hypothetical protein